ncbi:unnamed protein product, partial [Urochloa humidicola]
ACVLPLSASRTGRAPSPAPAAPTSRSRASHDGDVGAGAASGEEDTGEVGVAKPRALLVQVAPLEAPGSLLLLCSGQTARPPTSLLLFRSSHCAREALAVTKPRRPSSPAPPTPTTTSPGPSPTASSAAPSRSWRNRCYHFGAT